MVIDDAHLGLYDRSKGAFSQERFYAGQYNGAFMFELYARDSQKKLLYIDSTGLSVQAVSVRIGNNELKNDSDGNLCINGKKIVLEG